MRHTAIMILGFALCHCGSSDSSTLAGSSGGSAEVGGAAGASGMGGAAGGAGVCGSGCAGQGMTCDPADGQCKPYGTDTNVGATCSTSGADPVCGTNPNATCNDQTEDGFPGGYCSVEPCTTLKLCPIGSSCARLGAESQACFKNCTADSECRGPDYVCQDVTGLWVSGTSNRVCYLNVLACSKDADCPTPHPTCVVSDAGGLGSCT